MLRGRAAVVVGGATGIGRSTAVQLKRLGADVLVADQQLPSVNDNLRHTPFDVAAHHGRKTAWNDLVKASTARIGPVSMWINHTGVSGDMDFTPFGETSMDAESRAEIEKRLESNVNTMIDGTQIVLEHMQKMNAHFHCSIVNVAPFASFVPGANPSVYAGPVHRMNRSTKVIGKYLGPASKVRIHALSPGFTDLRRPLEEPDAHLVPQSVEWIEEVTGEKLMLPEDIGDAVAELLMLDQGRNGTVKHLSMRWGRGISTIGKAKLFASLLDLAGIISFCSLVWDEKRLTFQNWCRKYALPQGQPACRLD